MIILSFNGFRTRRGRKRNLKGSFGFSYFVVILSCRNKSDRIVAVVEALSIFFFVKTRVFVRNCNCVVLWRNSWDTRLIVDNF